MYEALQVQLRVPSRSGVGALGVRGEPRGGGGGEKASLAPEAGAVSTFSSAFKKRWKLDPSRRRPRPASPDGRTALPGGSLCAERCLVLNSRQPLFPAAQRPDTCEAAELKKRSGKDAAGSPAVPAPALYPWLRVGPLTQLSLAHLSSGETAEIRPSPHLCAGAGGPLSGRAVPGAPRTLFPSASGAPVPLRPCPACRAEAAPQVAEPGPPPADLSPDTQEARGPIPAPLCSPAGLLLGRRLLPRSAVEVRGAALGRDVPRAPSIRPPPNQGPFCLVFPMWTPRGAGRRRCAQPGAGAEAVGPTERWTVPHRRASLWSVRP
uniref:resuscitation-promoting factor RpfA-like n=1 Tax=Nyctereutes procyonoides TaxID=34880 RepID=UPI00244463CE|nr:resuscitation-promoting factor RpfA-like [Nyctereutes procyonoides]